MIASLLGLEHAARAESGADSAERRMLYYPAPRGTGLRRFALGLSVDVLPRRLVESELRQVPKLAVAARFGLPSELFFNARVLANGFVNELSLAFGGALRWNQLAGGAHARGAFWLGYVGVEGFDTTSWGVLTFPGLSVGYARMDGVHVSAGLEAILVHAQHVQLPDADVERVRFDLAGFIASVAVETALGNGGLIYYGVAVSWARPDYQLWLAFSDNDRWQPYPTFFAGYGF